MKPTEADRGAGAATPAGTWRTALRFAEADRPAGAAIPAGVWRAA